MNRLSCRIAALALVALCGVARVQAQAPAAPQFGDVGPETRSWVQLQTGNTAASPAERPMPGDIAEKVYQRHADSFARPIPESLGRQSFNEEGGGSGGGPGN